MRKTRHCAICENHTRSSSSGINCGLTTKKPNFGKQCDKIGIDQALLFKEIEKVNIGYQQVLRKKALTISNFIVFLTLSISIMLGGYLFGHFLYEKGWISTGPLIVMGMGIMILPFAFGPLNKYRQDMNMAKTKKNELEELLTVYGMEYSIDLDIQKGIHDIFEVKSEIEVRKNGQVIGKHANQQTIAEKPAKGASLSI